MFYEIKHFNYTNNRTFYNNYSSTIMFFGKVISLQTPFSFTADSAEEGKEVLSLTNVTLAPSSKEGAQLFVKKGTEKFLVALLTKERPQASINVYVTLADNVQLVVEGNGIIHITGYFEP